jgi:hypothetical protein
LISERSARSQATARSYRSAPFIPVNPFLAKNGRRDAALVQPRLVSVGEEIGEFGVVGAERAGRGADPVRLRRRASARG